MALVIGVRLDRHALPAEVVGHGPEPGQPDLLDLLQLGPMLLDHPLVMVGGERGQAVRQQVVHRVARLDRDHVPLLAEVLDRLDQQEFDPAVGRFGQPLHARFLDGCLRHRTSPLFRCSCSVVRKCRN